MCEYALIFSGLGIEDEDFIESEMQSANNS